MMQPGAVYASQSLRFAAPVYVGDEAIAEVRALNIKSAGGRHMYVPSSKPISSLLSEAIAVLPDDVTDLSVW
jgi:hypothetical protein